MKTVGTKKDVWEGKALRTSGGLTKSKLTLSKTGKVVSKAKQALGKQQYAKFGGVMQAHQFK
jgi:hypothetical protein